MGKFENITKHFPGMRIIKTALALAICVVIDSLRGISMPYQAGVAAIVCLQHGVSTTLQSSKNRAFGTAISGLYSYVFLRFSVDLLGLKSNTLGYNILVALAIIPLMFLLVKIRKPGSVAIAAIVFIVICFTTGQNDPLGYTLVRVTDTFIGILAAVFVEWFPPLKKFGEIYTEAMHIEIPEEIQKDLEGGQIGE